MRAILILFILGAFSAPYIAKSIVDKLESRVEFLDPLTRFENQNELILPCSQGENQIINCE